MSLHHDNPKIEPLEQKISRTILEIFGQYSPEYSNNQYFKFWDGESFYDTADTDYQNMYEKGLIKGKEIISGLIEEISEKKKYFSNTNKADNKVVVTNSSKCFIVHGRHVETKVAIARFLEKIGIEPIILHEQANGGRTIIEKFEDHSDVGFSVIILSDDDYGCLLTEYNDKNSLKTRARQNVVFEFGYFIGKMGRSRVAAVFKGKIEKPSDLDGIAYIEYDDNDGWKLQLAKELSNAKMQFDKTKVFE